ncbi:MAG: hypothetical protein AAF658_02265 [Myxococcota bacterium]
MRRVALVLIVFAVTGCARGYRMPYSAKDLLHDVEDDPGGALVFFLQHNPSGASVCNPKARTSVARHLDASTLAALIDASADLRVRTATLRDCLARAAPIAPVGPAIVDGLLRGSSNRARFRPTEAVLIDVYRSLGTRSEAPAGSLSRLSELLAQGTASQERWFARAIDHEQGLIDGTPATEAQIRAQSDHDVLESLSRRLPTQALRTVALGAFVAARIEDSPFSEVRNRAASVKGRVLAEGANAVDLRLTRIRSIRTSAPLPLYAMQDARTQRVGLSAGKGFTGVSLEFDVVGLSGPVTVCDADRYYDPTPCLRAREFSVSPPLASFDRRGRLRPIHHGLISELVTLLHSDSALELRHGAQTVGSVPVALVTEMTEALGYYGNISSPGPALRVRLQERGGFVVASIVNDSEASKPVRFVVVEANAGKQVRVWSQGGQGYTGEPGDDGSDGSNGADGSDAQCPSTDAGDGRDGSDGKDGEDGGRGGPGGDASDLFIELLCPEDCSRLERAALNWFATRGGPGGPGGAGGDGGDGGRGGDGGSGDSECNLSAGDDGSDGDDGRDGAQGPSGREGEPGAIRVTRVGRPAAM